MTGVQTCALPISLAIAIMSLLSTLYVSATRDNREVAQRISALEAHQIDGSARLERIENAVGATDAKIDRLIELVLGHKQK